MYALVFLATGCDHSEKGAPTKSRLATDSFVSFIGPPPTDPLARLYTFGVQRFDSRPLPPRVRSFAPADASAAALLGAVDAALEIKPAAVVLVVPEDGVSDVVAQRLAGLAGLLITIGPDAAQLNPAGRVDFDWANAAESLGAKLSKLEPTARSFVLLHMRTRNARAASCYERFSEAARATGGLRMLDEACAASADSDGGALISGMLRNFRHAGLVITLTPAPWLAGPRPFHVDSPHFVTFGAMPALWARLRSGEATALVGGIEPDLAYEGLKLAAELCNGAEAGAMRRLPCEVVTAESLDAFAKRYAAAAGATIEELQTPARPAIP